MSYAYVAYDRSGAERRGTIEASSDAEAMERLRREGLFATSVERSEGSGARRGRSRRGSLRGLVFALRQLAVLTGTGTPVVDALASVERQTKDAAWRGVLGDVRRRVEEGSTLAEAIGAHPGSFGTICQSLVAAGESAGNLSAMLDRVSRLVRRQQRVRSSMLGAMVYPGLLIAVSVGVLGVMIAVVMPRFAEMFESLDAPLPASTRVLMDMSGWLRAWWWLVLGLLISGGCGLVAWLRTPGGRVALDRMLVRAPGVGRLVRSVLAGQVARLLSVLLASRVPLIEAIELTRNTLGNGEYRDLMDRCGERVSKGEHLSAALEGSALIPASMCEALRSAERSGSVAVVLAEVADFIEEDNESLVKSLTSILEPMILIVLGALVAFVAISIFLPLFDLTATAGGGY